MLCLVLILAVTSAQGYFNDAFSSKNSRWCYDLGCIHTPCTKFDAEQVSFGNHLMINMSHCHGCCSCPQGDSQAKSGSIKTAQVYGYGVYSTIMSVPLANNKPSAGAQVFFSMYNKNGTQFLAQFNPEYFGSNLYLSFDSKLCPEGEQSHQHLMPASTTGAYVQMSYQPSGLDVKVNREFVWSVPQKCIPDGDKVGIYLILRATSHYVSAGSPDVNFFVGGVSYSASF